MNHACIGRVSKREDVETMARQVLAGGVRAVARVITWLENQEPAGAAVLAFAFYISRQDLDEVTLIRSKLPVVRPVDPR